MPTRFEHEPEPYNDGDQIICSYCGEHNSIVEVDRYHGTSHAYVISRAGDTGEYETDGGEDFEFDRYECSSCGHSWHRLEQALAPDAGGEE